MIRAQLCLLGRFKLEIMALDNEIHEFKDIYTRQQNYRIGNFMSNFRITSNKYNSVKNGRI